MSLNRKKIEALTREIEQKKARLSDLAQKAKEEDRRADTRRKIIYGGAFFALVNTLPPEKQERTMAAVNKLITNKKDREFLGLPPLDNRP